MVNFCCKVNLANLEILPAETAHPFCQWLAYGYYMGHYMTPTQTTHYYQEKSLHLHGFDPLKMGNMMTTVLGIPYEREYNLGPENSTLVNQQPYTAIIHWSVWHVIMA